MRVISGIRRGAKLITRDEDDVRPTTDRVKESMFNLLMGRFPCGQVLDLFAGSGALGIEAVSRGAERVVCVDSDALSMEIVKKNFSNLKLAENAEFVLSDAMAYLSKSNEKFDVVFLDPPYNKGLIIPVMDLLYKRDMLSSDGLVVAECDNTESLPDFVGFSILKQRSYGRTVVTIYEKEGI